MLNSIDRALVTGASGGIGAAFARQLAAEGVHLVLVARSEKKLRALADELAAQHGVQTHVLVAELSQPDSACSLFAETGRLGLAVDLLVNNAGFSKGGEFTELPFDVQADMVRLNVSTLTELTHLCLPAMRQRGRGGVINVASTAARQPVPYMAVYGATNVRGLPPPISGRRPASGRTPEPRCRRPTTWLPRRCWPLNGVGDALFIVRGTS